MLGIDAISADASERYVMVLNQFRGELRAAIQQNPRDVRTVRHLRDTLRSLALKYRDDQMIVLENEIPLLLDHAAAAAAADLGVYKPTVGLDILSDYSERLVDHASTEVTSQLQRDMAATLRSLEEFRLEVFMQRQGGMSDSEAQVRAFMHAKERIEFFFRDRAGRRLQSQKFIRTMTRHTLLTAYLEAYAVNAAAFGADHMIVVHPDPNASAAGMKVGFRRDQNLPLVADLKDEVFHPNSNATLKAVM